MIPVAQAEFIDIAQLVGGVALAGRDAQIQQARRLVGKQVEELIQFAQRIADQPRAISLSVRPGTASAFVNGRRSQSSGDEFSAPQQREIRCVERCVRRRRQVHVSGIGRVLLDHALDCLASRLARHRNLDRTSAEGLMGSIEERDRAVAATKGGEGEAHDPACRSAASAVSRGPD